MNSKTKKPGQSEHNLHKRVEENCPFLRKG